MVEEECKECGKQSLKIIGEGVNGGVEVECQNSNCNAFYEVEPDGLGMAGLEWVIAKRKSAQRV